MNVYVVNAYVDYEDSQLIGVYKTQNQAMGVADDTLVNGFQDVIVVYKIKVGTGIFENVYTLSKSRNGEINVTSIDEENYKREARELWERGWEVHPVTYERTLYSENNIVAKIIPPRDPCMEHLVYTWKVYKEEFEYLKEEKYYHVEKEGTTEYRKEAFDIVYEILEDKTNHNGEVNVG